MSNTRFLKRKISNWMKRRYFNTLPCFYCGADSFELKMVLIFIIGGLALSSVFVCIGLWLSGAYKNTEKLRDYPLKVEENNHE